MEALYICAVGLEILKFEQTSLFYSDSYFNWGILDSGDSKGGPGWAMAPQIFACPPPVFFLKFKVVWLTYTGLPNAFCKNTGHFVNSARSKLCHNS